ncbi:MAG TPA: hypothetical protein VE955_10045 [Candidatus Dormibacteraeota bacterium]|nr:hypothetical protein [Candidatus Dormibacteraeota bacterium]
MLLKDAIRKRVWKSLMARPRKSGQPSSSTKLILAVTVLLVVGIFTGLYYVESLQNQNNGILIDWRLKITYEDASRVPGINYTLPALIGSNPLYWANHTLDPFSPSPSYSPMSTRDGTGTIYLQSTQPAVFNFGDFYNVYGQTFNETCVGYAGVVLPNNTKLTGTYCARPAEPLIWDGNNNGRFDPATDINVTMAPDPFRVKLPPAGATLTADTRIMYASGGSPTWNTTESIVYDPDRDGVYNASTDPVLYNGVPSKPLVSGSTPLTYDPLLKFYDSNNNGRWDPSIPPPVLSDGTHPERCLSRGINFSNGYDWIIILWSRLYVTISDHCVPPGF